MILLRSKTGLLGILVLSLAACSAKKDRCIKGKVIRISCASFVVQVLNKDSVGSYGWRDVAGHAIYNNVFRVNNACDIGKFSRGEELYFTVSDSLPSNNCITCRMFDAPPEKSLHIENVSRKGCEETSKK